MDKKVLNATQVKETHGGYQSSRAALGHEPD
jgi:hypothetical protein